MSSQGHRVSPHRLGVVSFLNSQPLIEGLTGRNDIELVQAVPSGLPEMLDRGRVDVALVPVIDLAHRADRWVPVSDACIGCDGPTMTVRLFSQVPAERITVLHVDGESHTSVALARVTWREKYGTTLQIDRLDPAQARRCQAVLLIGRFAAWSRQVYLKCWTEAAWT